MSKVTQSALQIQGHSEEPEEVQQEEGKRRSPDAAGRKLWSEHELSTFKRLIPQLGRNYQAYQDHLPGRTYNQVKSQYHNVTNKKEEECDNIVVHSNEKRPQPQPIQPQNAQIDQFQQMVAELQQMIQNHNFDEK